MRMRLIPNYDPIPEALIRLREEVWHLDMKAETPIPIELNTQEETCELARRLTWLFANRGITRQPGDPAAQRRLRESITEARAALIVLFGLFFYGLGAESIIRLKTSEPSEIFVPKYGRSLPVPAVALSLARMHNEGKICTVGNYLFSVVSDTDTDEQIAAKAQRITARARKWLLREGFGLGNHSTLLGEWLTVAAATRSTYQRHGVGTHARRRGPSHPATHRDPSPAQATPTKASPDSSNRTGTCCAATPPPSVVTDFAVI